MTSTYVSAISRRAALRWLAGAMVPLFLTHSSHSLADTLMAFSNTERGYGTDPNLSSPTVPWPLIMTPRQLHVTAVLADVILPGTDDAPAPSVIGIADFVNEWLSAPYPDQLADRSVVLSGIDSIDLQAQTKFGKSFIQIEARQQHELVETLAIDDGSITSPSPFFRRFRYLVVGGYYTTQEGFKAIGYIGNVPLTSFPPISEQERAILDAELRKLGV